MPISATGSERFRDDAGITLVEALVTLAIIALMAGAVVMLAPSPARQTRAFAEQFAARLAMASEESIMANKPVALVLDAQGHGFARLEEGGWRPLPQNTPLAFRAWPQDVSYRVQDAEAADAESGRVVRFDALGAATPARIVLSRAGVRYEIAVDGQGRTRVGRVD